MTDTITPDPPAPRRRPRRRHPWFVMIVTLALLAVGGTFLDEHHHTFDLTVSHSLTLTDQTRELLRDIHTHVHVTALAGRGEAGRPEAAALLARYHRFNHRVTYEVVDPLDAPAKLQRLRMDPSVDVVAASVGRRVARGPTITEQDVSSVIAQVVRNATATLCVATGHGEPALGDENEGGLAAASRLLEHNGYHSVPVDLLTVKEIPASCTGVLLANPMSALGPAVDVLGRYLAHNGRLTVLADPESTVDLNAVLAPYRLSVERGIAVDTDPDAHLPDDAATLILRNFHSTNPMVRRLAPSLFPAADAVVIGDLAGATEEGLAVEPVIVLGDRSYLERHPERPGFTPGEDRRGPIVIAAAADRSRVVNPTTIERSRVAVIGDADFATNKFIAQGGNARLLVQTIDWVTLQEDLVPLNTNIAPLRPLELTSGRTRYMQLLSAGIIPAAFLLAGAWVWAIRRTH